MLGSTIRMNLGMATVLAALLLAVAARADEADDRYAIAAGHYGQERWKMAVEEFRTFLDAFPNHAKADSSVFLLAESLLQSNNREEAQQSYRAYLDRQPSGPYARAALFRAGEMAYLSKSARTRVADVTVASDAKIITVPTERLAQATESCQHKFDRAFMDILVERLSMANLRMSGV